MQESDCGSNEIIPPEICISARLISNTTNLLVILGTLSQAPHTRTHDNYFSLLFRLPSLLLCATVIQMINMPVGTLNCTVFALPGGVPDPRRGGQGCHRFRPAMTLTQKIRLERTQQKRIKCEGVYSKA